MGVSFIKNDSKNSYELLKIELRKTYKHKTESEIAKITMQYITKSKVTMQAGWFTQIFGRDRTDYDCIPLPTGGYGRYWESTSWLWGDRNGWEPC